MVLHHLGDNGALLREWDCKNGFTKLYLVAMKATCMKRVVVQSCLVNFQVTDNLFDQYLALWLTVSLSPDKKT